jgi:predicted amidohydrolase YtcJ
MATLPLMATPADLVIHSANILTVDSVFNRAEALAVTAGRIVTIGTSREVEKLIGANTQTLDAKGHTIMPGLYDSHVHSFRASVSEFSGSVPPLTSLAGAFAYIQEKVAKQPPGTWIVLERVYPTRMREGRLPTKAELDKAAPNNPVYWNCGPVSMANSKALEVSAISADTPNPVPGEIVKDSQTGQPTGLLRNAAQLLKVTASSRQPTPSDQRQAVKHLHHLYNQQGITSIAERRGEFAALDTFRDLAKAGELTVRVNSTRMLDPVPKTIPEAIHKLDELTKGPDGNGTYGPTGVGDDWVRIGPLKVLLDGGMLIGTAYMREPWGCGDTYQITDPAYRGILNVKPDLLHALYLEGAKRGWQLAAHCTGEASVDVLLDCYEAIQKEIDIRHRRSEICHANFQSEENFQHCQKLGVVADMQPAWLYKDGNSLLQTLGERRMSWFQPLKSWFDRGLVIGGGSDHMVILDSLTSTNPWNPWLGMWIALTRHMEDGGVHLSHERLSREQAIRFYTINCAKLNFEEKKKGSLEPGKFADLIMIDRDISRCPVEDVRNTKVLLTMLNGKIVWQAHDS